MTDKESKLRKSIEDHISQSAHIIGAISDMVDIGRRITEENGDHAAGDRFRTIRELVTVYRMKEKTILEKIYRKAA